MVGDFRRRVNHYVDEHGLLPDGAAVVAAVSGGPDSLALLDYLLSEREKRGLKITVAHFEHGLRGRESLDDAAFVKNFCRANHVECKIKHGDVKNLAKDAKLSLEDAARKARYEFFGEICSKIRQSFQAPAPLVLATGHHADDQAETVLLHLLYGAGLKGLGGIRPRRFFAERPELNCHLVRPFLGVDRAAIEKYLAACGLKACHDTTNDDAAAARRNSLRHELLPLLKERFNPQISTSFCRLAEIAAAADDFIKNAADDCESSIVTNAANQTEKTCIDWQSSIDRAKFSVAPIILQQAVLGRLLDNADYHNREKARRFIIVGESGKRLSLPKREIIIEYDAARIVSREKFSLDNEAADKGEAGKIISDTVTISRPSPDEKVFFIWRKMRFSLRQTEFNPADAADASVIFFDGSAVKWPLVIRPRRNGDRYILPQSETQSCQKIKDLLINAKVPRRLRDEIPVIADGDDNVIWIAGIRRSGFAAVSRENRHDVYRMELENRGCLKNYTIVC